METKLYASGKARAGEGGVGAANKASGIAMTSGVLAGWGAGALAGSVLDEGDHHGAWISFTRSGLVRRVWARSEAGSCTARMKRAPSSGVSAAYTLSVEPKVQYSVPRATWPSRTHQD